MFINLILVLGSIFKRSVFYISAALGGFMMGIMDLLVNSSEEAPIDENGDVLIFQIGEKLSKAFDLSIGAGIGSGEAVIGLAFLTSIGFLIVFLKTPNDKWESFMAGFTSFALMAALISSDRPEMEGIHHNTQEFETMQLESTLKPDQAGLGLGDAFKGISLIATAHADESHGPDPASEVQHLSEFLLYIKGGKYLKPLKTIVRVFDENNDYISQIIYRGNRERFFLEPGSYRLVIYAKTHSGAEFQFYTSIQIGETTAGGFIDLEKSLVEPIGVFSKYTRQYQSATLEELPKVDLYKQLGLYNFLIGNYETALDQFELAKADTEATDSQLHQIEVFKGYTLFRNNHLSEAKSILEKAYIDKPAENHAWINLLKVLCKMNDFKAASEIYAEGLAHNRATTAKDGEFQRECNTTLNEVL